MTRGEDPPSTAFRRVGAALVGKRAALFVPSGTLGNQLCLRAHAEPGREVIVEGQCHIIRYEQVRRPRWLVFNSIGSAAGKASSTAEQVEAAIRPIDPYSIQTALICIENTHNAGGGTIYPLATIRHLRSRERPPRAHAPGWRQTVQCGRGIRSLRRRLCALF